MADKLVYVCEGGDCSERGSVELCERLRARLAERDPEGALARVSKYPCFGGCEHGINVTIWPDRVFYSQVTDADLPEIVAHIAGDGPKVERLTGIVEPDVEEVIWDMLDSPYSGPGAHRR